MSNRMKADNGSPICRPLLARDWGHLLFAAMPWLLNVYGWKRGLACVLDLFAEPCKPVTGCLSRMQPSAVWRGLHFLVFCFLFLLDPTQEKDPWTMTQAQLNRAVSRATGEDPATIARLGFVVLTRGPVERERKPLVIDWDDHYAAGREPFKRRRS
jgi:hypothetical protein